MCCILLMPFTWAMSAFNSLLSITGLLLAIFSKKAGYTGSMPIWGIVLNGIALVLSIAGVVISLVWGAAIMNMPPPQNTTVNTTNDAVTPKTNDVKPAKVYEREEFRNLVSDEDQAFVTRLIGPPDSLSTRSGETTWTYKGITRNPVTGMTDFSTEVIFRGGKVIRINLIADEPRKR
jgi:hypothetical protein